MSKQRAEGAEEERMEESEQTDAEWLRSRSASIRKRWAEDGRTDLITERRRASGLRRADRLDAIADRLDALDGPVARLELWQSGHAYPPDHKGMAPQRGSLWARWVTRRGEPGEWLPVGNRGWSRTIARMTPARLEALEQVATLARRMDTVPAMRLDRPTWGEMSDALDALDALEADDA